MVPSWNYIAVDAYGPVEFFEHADRLLDVVTRLTDLPEGGRTGRWIVADVPEAFIGSHLKGVVGLWMPMARPEGKRRMSQNRSA